MTSEKKPPNLAARAEADLTRDLRKVGGFFKGLLRFTEKAERVVQEAAREEPRAREEMIRCASCDAWKPLHIPCGKCRAADLERAERQRSRPIARVGAVEVLPKCEICNDERTVGQGKKIPCPACSKTR